MDKAFSVCLASRVRLEGLDRNSILLRISHGESPRPFTCSPFIRESVPEALSVFGDNRPLGDGCFQAVYIFNLPCSARTSARSALRVQSSEMAINIADVRGYFSVASAQHL